MRFALLLSISVALLPAQIEPRRVGGKVLAIDDAGFRKAFESQAVALKLEEKLHQNIELVLILKEAMDVEVAKIH
jgi:hypothetical protein